jgi:hypothetical protein
MTSATRTKRAPLKLARYATDPDELQRAIALHPSGSVAVDLETKGLHPHATADAAIGAVIVEHAGVQYILRELPSWWPDLLADAV